MIRSAIQHLCNAEVTEFEAAVGIDTDVLRLDVSVDDAAFAAQLQSVAEINTDLAHDFVRNTLSPTFLIDVSHQRR